MALVQRRPDIRTGALLDHFDDRPEADALQKLAAITLPGDEAAWRVEFADAIARLDQQTMQQRVDELQLKQREGALDAVDKAELRDLLQARMTAR